MSDEIKKFDWRKRVYLAEQNGWWNIKNEKGRELSSPRRFSSKIDAIMWAEAWVSSWPTKVELVINNEKA